MSEWRASVTPDEDLRHGAQFRIMVAASSVRDTSGNAGPAEPFSSAAEVLSVNPAVRARVLKLALAGVGRTLAADAVDVIGNRFERPVGEEAQVTLGGRSLVVRGDGGRASGGLARQVAEALGTEVTPPSGHEGWETVPSASMSSPVAGAPNWMTGATPDARAWVCGPKGLDETAGGRSSDDGVRKATTAEPCTDQLSMRHSQARPWGSNVADAGVLQGESGTSAYGMEARDGSIGFRQLSTAELLSQSAFVLSLDPKNGTGTGSLMLWGRGSLGHFSSAPRAGISTEGDIRSGYLGVDYRWRDDALLGVALSRSLGKIDYRMGDGEADRIETRLTSVFPYVHWTLHPGLDAWGLLGAGRGDALLRDADGEVSTALRMVMVAGGARQALTKMGGIDLAVKADVFSTRLTSSARAYEIDEVRAAAHRARLVLEGRASWLLSGTARLEPSLEFGGRRDSGDAETGAGAEFAGGIVYTNTGLGLSIDVRGRTLLAHRQSGFKDWGVSVALRLAPDASGRGLSASLTPVWGKTSGGAEALWGTPAWSLSDDADRTLARRMDLELGYGLPGPGGHGLVTPYGHVSLADNGSRHMRLGARYEAELGLSLSLEAAHGESGTGYPSGSEVFLLGALRW